MGEVKHEVGTRVRVNEPGDRKHGTVGTIVEIANWKHTTKYTHLVDNREEWVSGRWYAPENLERVDDAKEEG